MNNFDDINRSSNSSDVVEGLRAYMLRVYNYMGFGLIVTAVAAYLTASSPYMLNLVFGTPLQWVVMFAPLVFVLVLSFGINKLSLFQAQVLFWLFAGVMGVSLSAILIVYTGASVARVFLITAATFLVMSIYGYTTRKDLSRFGSILFMGLIGIVIASLVNIFMKSTMLDFAISVIGVIVFTGLIAFDTQKIKGMYYDYSQMEESAMKKTAIFAALTLYLDFINLFIMLIRLIGDRRQ